VAEIAKSSPGCEEVERREVLLPRPEYTIDGTSRVERRLIDSDIGDVGDVGDLATSLFSTMLFSLE
jgi:hypothetical protein